ncbi:hypothetical protein [Spongorhabdus nitratireducens]
MRILQAAALVAGLIVLSGCVSTVNNDVHHAYDKKEVGKESGLAFDTHDSQPAEASITKVLILPADIRISELGMTAVEEVPEWSAEGKKLVNSEIKSYIKNNLNNVEIVVPPVFSKQSQDQVDQHVALYDVVAGNSLSIRNIEAFKEELKKPDDTLGKGLKFLKQETGADQVLLVSGVDLISSEERVASMVVAAAFGVVIPGGVTVLNTGLIDIETGDVVWTNTALSTSLSLKKQSGARDMVSETLGQFPKL